LRSRARRAEIHTATLRHFVDFSPCTGIHPNGKPPQAAAREIARIVARILEQRRSGVALKE
jgi:hypothetical protein